MAISARNMFEGKISAIRSSRVNAEVTLTTPEQLEIVAIITLQSLKEMGIQVGQTALAYIKAPWILLHKGEKPIQASARNQFLGQVRQLKRGMVNIMVTVALAEGSLVQTVITKDAFHELALAEGDRVGVLFKASHVLLGIFE